MHGVRRGQALARSRKRRADVHGQRGAAALLACALASAPLRALAQDADAALAPFASRPAQTAAATADTTGRNDRVRPSPPDALDWERRLRPYGQAAPPPPWRALDQALVDAARVARDDDIRKLLARGALPDQAGDDGFTALGAAAFAGWRTTVRLLLRAGAEPARTGANGQTALHLAALAGHLAVVDEMLRLGVPVDLLNRQRETALDVAANANQQATMQRLIDAGADTAKAGRR